MELELLFKFLNKYRSGIFEDITFEVNSVKNLYGIRYDYLLISFNFEYYEIIRNFSTFFMVDWTYQNSYNDRIWLEVILKDKINLNFIHEIEKKKSVGNRRISHKRSDRKFRF
jgi:hypothetical protein